MEVEMIAVMGASGNIGGQVADLLLREGKDVRVFGRSEERLEPLGRRGAELVVGNALELDDLRRLFHGAGAALVVLPDDLTDARFASNRSHMSRNIAQALRDEHVERVVVVSSLGAHLERGNGPMVGLHELERLMFELEDASVLVLRSAWHMENLLANLPMIQAQGINGSALLADHPFPMIAKSDVASRAAGRLLGGDFSGHLVETILGPEDVSMAEATRALGVVLGRPDLKYVEFPPAGVKAALTESGMPEEVAELLVEAQIAINEDRLIDGVQRTAETTTPTRLEDVLARVLPR